MIDTAVHQGRRHKLVRELASKGIENSAVLSAMVKVPRHFFFPKDFEQYAYRDAAFPIGHDQTISQPFTVAYQSQLIDIQKGERVLEIGTGSGYQAAVLLEMGVELYSIEYIKPLLQKAAELLKKYKGNVHLIHGDGSKGVPKYAPYDAIIVTAGAPTIQNELLKQLKIGGKLVIPVGDEKEKQRMHRLTRMSENKFHREVLGDFKFVPLVGDGGWK
jgi:protein-L-isoaspartate(D-aspartate) O-methyltransferase